MASPIAASAAATVRMNSAKIWPVRSPRKAEKATRLRLTESRISSTDIKTTMMFLRFKITPATPSVNRMAATIKNCAGEVLMMVSLWCRLRASLQCPVSNSLPRGNLADLDRLGRCPRVLDCHVLAFHAGLVAQSQHDGADHGGQQDEPRCLEQIDILGVKHPPERHGIRHAGRHRRRDIGD